MQSFTSRPEKISRRSVLAGLMACSACGTIRQSAHSAAPELEVPIVDSLTINVVVDAATFGPFLPDLDVPGLSVQRSFRPRSNDSLMLPRKTLMAEFGLCLWAESTLGGATRNVMIDFGYTPTAVTNNLGLMALDPEKIDAAILSHGHLDHYGGFAGIFALPRVVPVPLIVGGEEVFCERLTFAGSPSAPAILMGTLDREALLRAGFEVQVRSGPALLADHGFTTGTIPLVTGERVAIPTQMRPGNGCEQTRLSVEKRSSALMPDDAEHELATCYVVRGLGLVVITSCGHRGVLNSVKKARAVSGVSKVHAVIGGFHLVNPRTAAEAADTAADMEDIDPAWIIPMHCTGEVFTAEVERRMPGRVLRPYVGNRFTFSA